MAFFKFRFPGHKPVLPADGQADGSVTLESVRRQARYRLVGAAVLVLVAVIVFPLIFDTQPRPVAVDIPIVVPDRHTAPALSGGPLPPTHLPAPAQKPEVQMSAIASAPALSTPSVSATAQAPSQMADPSAAAEAASTVPAAQPQPPAAAPAPLAPSPAGRAVPPVPAADRPKAPAVPREEDARARALLEGGQVPGSVAAERHVLQVGAYNDPAKVREVRRKLEQAGLKTYTQAVEGKDGKRVVRVRIGPYDSKADADKVAARVRQLDLPVSVLRL